MGCIFWPLTLLSGSFGIYFLLAIGRQVLVRWKGTPVEGRITNRWVEGSARWGTFYHVTYYYIIAGRTYVKKQYVSTKHYLAWDMNTQVRVLYLAKYPSVAILGEDNGNSFYFAFCTIVLLGVTIYLFTQALR